jgi:serine/threonine-protein kinase HipA
MRSAEILYKDQEAGLLTQQDDGWFTFRYHDVWMNDSNKPGISLSLPKSKQEYHSPNLFPFFFHMLPEGSNKLTVCKMMRIDPDDHFGLLLTTAKNDTIGAVKVIKTEQVK